MGMSSSIYMAG